MEQRQEDLHSGSHLSRSRHPCCRYLDFHCISNRFRTFFYKNFPWSSFHFHKKSFRLKVTLSYSVNAPGGKCNVILTWSHISFQTPNSHRIRDGVLFVFLNFKRGCNDKLHYWHWEWGGHMGWSNKKRRDDFRIREIKAKFLTVRHVRLWCLTREMLDSPSVDMYRTRPGNFPPFTEGNRIIHYT